jgi:hypothetical protein
MVTTWPMFENLREKHSDLYEDSNLAALFK